MNKQYFKLFKQNIDQIIKENNILVNFTLTDNHYNALSQVCGWININSRHVKGYIDSINREK